MKEIKLSFPYPSTSRHNLSQDVALSMSMGLVTPVRIIEVNPGDSHRIGTSFSLISNPLVKPLLQGVKMRYTRFWVPRRIYHIDQRANNSNYDPMSASVRNGSLAEMTFPLYKLSDSNVVSATNFQASSLFDYLGLASMDKYFFYSDPGSTIPSNPFALSINNQDNTFIGKLLTFNAEPLIAYYDICRTHFADSANNSIAFFQTTDTSSTFPGKVVVAPLTSLDAYIDGIQNSRGPVNMYNWGDYSLQRDNFKPFYLPDGKSFSDADVAGVSLSFNPNVIGVHHNGLCVPMMRPDRLSRLFDTRPLTSQSAVISSSEVSISNLSFLAKFQRFLTRRFFGGSRYTDIMYSIFGQKVPHVDSPVLLDVFDYEIGSELVASTNADANQTPGVLGGYFSASGYLTSPSGRRKMRYFFNESGYLIDLCYIMPRVYRTAFMPDFYPIEQQRTSQSDGMMSQGNFAPDFNGIGWQQPAFVGNYSFVSSNKNISLFGGFSCEPSWQQYRTLPDVCRGLLNPINGNPSDSNNYSPLIGSTLALNSPLFVFTDRMIPYVTPYGYGNDSETFSDAASNTALFSNMYLNPNSLNSVFGTSSLIFDNFFVVFNYSHQVKSQVTKRFTLSFN